MTTKLLATLICNIACLLLLSSAKAQNVTLNWALNPVDENSSGGAKGHFIKTDAAGNVYVTGNFQDTVDFDPSAATANLTCAGNCDIFLAKYDANGNYLWAKAMGGTHYDEGFSLAIDASGNVYLTGYFGVTADLDPSAATANHTSAGGWEIFLAKYDANGNYLWSKAMGGSSDNVGFSLTLDANGDIYLTGSSNGTADFDPSPAAAYLTSAGLRDVFLAKYDANGNYQWAKMMGGMSEDGSSYLALDASGNVYITGYFSDTADFDPSTATSNLISSDPLNIFLAKYDSNGNYMWSRGMGGSDYDCGFCVALDATGNAYLTGSFGNTVDFDPSAATANLTSAGGYDVFLAKYDTNGNYLWAKAIGKSSDDAGNFLTLDANENVYLTGCFGGTTDFDPSTATANLNSAGAWDIFLAKYDSNGNYEWAKAMGGTGYDSGISLALDTAGNIHMTGYFGGTAIFNGDMNTTASLTALGLQDAFIAKYHEDAATTINKLSVNNDEFFIYPNPASQILNVEYEMINKTPNICIVDVLGNVVTHNSSLTVHHSNRVSINVEALGKGVYFVKVGNTILKFVKQ